MRFSIIIPTYNRAGILKKALAAIEQIDFPKNEFEVIVVNDGSPDGTKDVVGDFMGREAIDIKYLEQVHRGQAQARNLGLDNARGEIILFLGDDTFPGRNLLHRHEQTHRSAGRPVAVLGLVEWDFALGVSDFMKYIAPNGPQFHFGTIKNFQDAGWNHFYTSNISVPRALVGDLRFDPRFSDVYAAFEDIDFGLALARRGVKIFFNPEALVSHHHFYEPDAFYKRMVMLGRSFPLFCQKHKNNRPDYWRLKWQYAPFNFLPGQLRVFHRLSRILAKSKSLKKISLKYHWFFNACYYYSLGMITELKTAAKLHESANQQ